MGEFEALLDEYRLFGVPYGHFGDGCIHVRIDFPFGRAKGKSVFRDFLNEAAALAARHGGTMSGEHGDGRARSELLPHMYTAEALALCAAVKDVFDPEDVLNPGVIVRPAPVDEDLRAVQLVPLNRGLGLAYRDDRGDLARAVHRCTGVGKCRADNTALRRRDVPVLPRDPGGEGLHAGRARVLQEVVSGKLGPDGWKSDALHDVLDLCLSCKGCASDCPTGVDMASYKAEALHRRYRRRIRPRAHYALGWLPRWTRLAAKAPASIKALNAVMQSRALKPLVAWSAGIDRRRTLPAFAPVTFRRWFTSHRSPEGATATSSCSWTASPTRSPRRREGDRAGTGARRLPRDSHREPGLLRHHVDLDGPAGRGARAGPPDRSRAPPHVRRGAKVVGMEPSCTGVLRSDAEELLRGVDAAAAREVAAATRTLAELLAETGDWTPPDLSGVTGIAQPHCHHHAVMGWTKDAALLKKAGAEVGRLGGCCGLVNSFGVEKGHHDVSVAVAETQLLPAVRRTGEDEVVLADGFSCRTQLADLANRNSEHLAQLLARHLPVSGGLEGAGEVRPAVDGGGYYRQAHFC